MIDEKERARLAARALWVKACKYDGVPMGAKFVCLSPENPFADSYSRAIEKYIALLPKDTILYDIRGEYHEDN